MSGGGGGWGGLKAYHVNYAKGHNISRVFFQVFKRNLECMAPTTPELRIVFLN